jgi:hypothetical protein
VGKVQPPLEIYFYQSINFITLYASEALIFLKQTSDYVSAAKTKVAKSLMAALASQHKQEYAVLPC